MWDLDALQCSETWVGHSKAVLKLQQQGPYVFSIGGSSIRVWCTASGTCQQRLLTARTAGAPLDTPLDTLLATPLDTPLDTPRQVRLLARAASSGCSPRGRQVRLLHQRDSIRITQLWVSDNCTTHTHSHDSHRAGQADRDAEPPLYHTHSLLDHCRHAAPPLPHAHRMSVVSNLHAI